MIDTMSEVRVYFVLPNDCEDEESAPELMIEAYDACRHTVKEMSWARESELDYTSFTKFDCIVFDTFEGHNLNKYIERKCKVLGPRALIICLTECKPIPNYQWPIFNVAMYGCQITFSQLPKHERPIITEKVKLMGGLCLPEFTEKTTHLVCEGTKSEKYLKAIEHGAKVMRPDWVHELFEASKSSYVHADDADIVKKFKCPPFLNLIICSTGMPTKERTRVTALVEENGGSMVSQLNVSKTDVLICYGSAGTTSAKYKAANSADKNMCVTLAWIYDSIEKGYALPRENYQVKGTSASTPTKEGENIDPNFSTISSIGISMRSTTVDETINMTSSRQNMKRKANELLVDKLDIKKMKSAGSFLEGCSILVVGFSSEVREKLHKIINASGATRYDSFSNGVSHVIVGDPNCTEVASIKTNGTLVNLQWLIDSVEHKRPVDEEKYLISNNPEDSQASSTGSPLNKKMLSFLSDEKTGNSQINKSVPDESVNLQEDTLTQKYLQNLKSSKDEDDTLAKLLEEQDPFLSKKDNNVEEHVLNQTHGNNETITFKPNSTSTQVDDVNDEVSEEIPLIFQGLTFFADGFTEENMEILKEQIEAFGGSMSDKGSCDYALYPVVWTPSSECPNAKETVNILWFNRCIEEETLWTNLEYYYRTIEAISDDVLKDCVITISGYLSDERSFLRELTNILGGTFQDELARKSKNHLLASTHLICPLTRGKKYEAAVRWNIPVVRKDWLLECLKHHARMPTQGFSPATPNCSSEEDCSKANVNCGTITSVADVPTKNINTTVAKTAQDELLATPKNLNKRKSVDPCSQVTPINKLIQDAIDNKVLPTPPTPRTYYPWDPKTPDTPLGAFINPNPSPGLRKEMQKYVNSFPDFVPSKRRLSTPLSELKRRLRDKVLGRGEFSPSKQVDDNPGTSQCRVEVDEVVDQDLNEDQQLNQSPSHNLEVHQKLQALHEKIMANAAGSATRRSSRMFESISKVPGIEKSSDVVQSQVCTVGWDYGEDRTQDPQLKIFMLSGIQPDQREQLASYVEELGATVSMTTSFDPTATHLICPSVNKNEKSLGSMAAGKWILHPSYIEDSKAAGRFLDEEDFEFGNPKASSKEFFNETDSCVCFWRKEIRRRGYGAFHDMRAIVIAQRKQSIINVIEAGGGVVVNVDAPYEDTIHATHCLLELKMVKDFSTFVPLARQGIKCLNTIYISDFLKRIKNDESEYIPPYFIKYYKK